MKVLENLENYEIPAGFRLTSEQEDQLALDLAEIVNALIPIRTSKLKTRKYFNEHLRYTSNVNDYLDLPDTPEDKYEFGESYKPLPGEYTWHSDLLQPALLNILSVEEYCFGFVINYLNEDIARRKHQRPMKGSTISDALVKFCNQFNIDEIRKEAKAIPDITERLLFLHKVDTDCRIFDGLTLDEDEWIASPILQSLSVLIEEAEKEQKLAPKNDGPRKGGQNRHIGKSDKSIERSDGYKARRNMLYDLFVLTGPKFSMLNIPIPTLWDSFSSANKKAFSEVLGYMFGHCYDGQHELTPNQLMFDRCQPFIYALIDSYTASLKSERKISDRDLMKKLVAWGIETYKAVENAYIDHRTIYSEELPIPNEDGTSFNSIDTKAFKFALLEGIFGYLSFSFNEIGPAIDDSLKDEVPFNVWDSKYKELKRLYSNKFGLEFHKRAVVNVDDNKSFFKGKLDDDFYEMSRSMTVDFLFDDPQKAVGSMDCHISAKFHSLFRDYLSRIQHLSFNKEDIDAAMLDWTVSLADIVWSHYYNDRVAIERNDQYGPAIECRCPVFFLDICFMTVLEIMSEYFKDFEKLEIVQEPLRLVPPPEPEEEPEEAPEVTDPLPPPPTDKKHSKNIEYEKLYNELNKVAFVNTSLVEFTTAIDNANFSGMLAKAKDAGTRSGYIGGVKYIIKKMRIPLGANWFNIACETVGETYDSLNKLTETTKKIQKISRVDFDEYIK